MTAVPSCSDSVLNFSSLNDNKDSVIVQANITLNVTNIIFVGGGPWKVFNTYHDYIPD